MSTIGVISDIHGNLPALESVIAELQSIGVDEIICVGDIIGISGFPAETIECVQDNCSVIIKGNHDILPFDGDPETDVFSVEKQVFFDETTETQQSWLYNLPTIREFDKGVYGSWETIVSHAYPEPQQSSGHTKGNAGVKPREYIEVGAQFDEMLLLLGHTHVPHSVDLRSYDHEVVICNPGSVGGVYQDEANFAVVDTDDYSVENLSVEYDTETKWDRIKELEATYNVSLLD